MKKFLVQNNHDAIIFRKLLSFQGHQWTPQSTQNTSLRYMKLEPNSPGFIDEPFVEQMKLWNSLNIE